jgi:glycogen debranching enzyme
MGDPWNFTGESAPLGHLDGTVTLVQGSAFCISGRSGDVYPDTAQGLIFRDTRFLSRCELRVNGTQPEPLAAATINPFSATYVSRTRPRSGRRSNQLMLFRYRYIGRGMREDLVVRNFADEPAYCSIEYAVEADFADLFEVKEARVHTTGERQIEPSGRELIIRHRHGSVKRGTLVSFSEMPVLTDETASFEVIVPANGEWTLCMQLTPVIEGEEITPRYQCGQAVDLATPVQRLEKWRSEIPIVETDHDGLQQVVLQSEEDLGALRIFDPDFPERAVVAAGAPWFMTLFGRDACITSWMALLLDPELATGVLQTLARFQGDKVDDRTEEQPGKILHEMRFGDSAGLSLGGGHIYFGTADATPLFVMLLGELQRWGLAPELVEQLLPHAYRAIEWIENFGDMDGDGYIEYQRKTDRGLYNQGWKDSWDGIRFANGEVARPPTALCEVQAYTYSAYQAMAHFARESGKPDESEKFAQRAADLKEAFNRDFWLEEKGYFAVGLDHEKRQIDSLTSNIGHCLWTGIVDEDKAQRVAQSLMTNEMYSGWGVRTLASNMGGYDPISYHCGSVWPHDNAITAAGLMRYGFVEEAQKIAMSIVDSGISQGGRLSELFTGLDRWEFPKVVSYPTSCSPQAWAAASPLLFLRMFLRLDPAVSAGKVWCAPALPVGMKYLHVERIPLGGSRVSVRAEGDDFTIEGLPDGMELIREPRKPTS